jgi:hypothetical protein
MAMRLVKALGLVLVLQATGSGSDVVCPTVSLTADKTSVRQGEG